MKIIVILLFTLFSLAITSANGQVADGISYQAVALDERGKEIAGHDINGNIIHSEQIDVRFSILSGTQSGEILYKEVHSTYTDQFGLFSLVIGHGDVSADSKYQKLIDIDWGADKLFLKVEIDITHSGNFKIMGIQQMMSVPFAFHALTSLSTTTVHYSDILNKPTLSTVATSGNYDDLINKPIPFSQKYGDLTNKPFLFDGNYNSLTNIPSIPTKTSDLLNDAGYLTSYTETDPSWTTVSANYYTKSNMQTSGASLVHFNNITDKPTTMSGYGITDAFNGSWVSLTGKPSTLSGYGITNAMSTSHAAFVIASADISNWNAAFSWGDHTAAGYQPLIAEGTITQYWRGDKTWQPLNKASVGLSNVENAQLSTWAGSSNLTTLGTITSGIWKAGAVTSSGAITANSIVITGGSSSQFLKADGSLDANNYITGIREETDEFSAANAQTGFTLSHVPLTNSKVKMYINGVRISNSAYSKSGITITYFPANNGSYVLEVGDRIQFDYSY